jgi:hypothetical protein
MEIFNSECEHHFLPINSICTEYECESNQLCDICLNSHSKEHKYLISISSINNNTFEKIIEKNEEIFKNNEKLIIEHNKVYIEKVESDFKALYEILVSTLERNKKSLLKKLQNINDNFLEQARIWNNLKIEYSKHFLQCLDEDTKTLKTSKNFSFLNDEIEKDFLKMDDKKDLSIISSCSKDNSPDKVTFRHTSMNKEDNFNNGYTDSFQVLLSTINTVIERQIYFHKKNKENGTNVFIEDFHKNVKESIHDDFEELKREFLKISEEKIKFNDVLNTNSLYYPSTRKVNKLNKSPNSYSQKKKSSKSPAPKDKVKPNKKINFNDTYDDLENSYSSIHSITSNLVPIAEKNVGHNNISSEKNSLTGNKKENVAGGNNKKESVSSRNYSSQNIVNIYKGSQVSPYFSMNKQNQSACQNIHTSSFTNLNTKEINENDVKNLEVENSKDLFIEKKGSWYSLEYIQEYDFIVCGYSNGEILIFKESDSTPVKTFRPRFKKIRQLIYSAPNSSIFASYDDGYIVVIYLPDFKIEHFRMSTAQIYSMEIMENSNILIFGGVEKKILYSHVTNLNKIFLFYDSKEGEVQSLLYEESRDLLISAFRKSCLLFFKYSANEIMHKHTFEEKESCGMVLKKYKEDCILTCGFLLNIHLFKFTTDNKVEHVAKLNLKYSHLYHLDNFYCNYLIATTYDEGKIIIVDVENQKILKTFSGYKGNIQVKFLPSKNLFYVTSYCENLKKVEFKGI